MHWVLTGWWAAAILTGTLTVAPESADAEAGHPTVLCLVLRGGRLSARLALLAGGGPLSPVWLEIGTAAGVERWEFEKWKEWPAGPRLPGRVTHRWEPAYWPPIPARQRALEPYTSPHNYGFRIFNGRDAHSHRL